MITSTATSRTRRFSSRLALALSLALGAAVALPGCGDTGGTTAAGTTAGGDTKTPARTAPPPSTPVTAGRVIAPNGARLSFTKITHDFGQITDTRTYETSYPFRNSGTGTLIISSVKAGCGCTVPVLDKYEYAPGEQGKIDVTFDPKAMSGNKPKNITVVSNSSPDGTIRLQFTSSIKPLVTFETRFLKLGEMQLGDGHRQRFNMWYQDPDLQIVGLEATVPWITASLVEDKVPVSGGGYRATAEVVVSPDAPWGTLYSVRMKILVTGRVELDIAPIEYDYELYVQGSIFGDLIASASMRGRRETLSSSIPFGQLPPGAAFEKSVRIKRQSGQPFNITDVRLSDDTSIPGLTVRYEPVSPTEYAVYVAGNTGSFVGLINGSVEVRTDVPNEEILTIRLMGRVTG